MGASRCKMLSLDCNTFHIKSLFKSGLGIYPFQRRGVLPMKLFFDNYACIKIFKVSDCINYKINDKLKNFSYVISLAQKVLLKIWRGACKGDV